MRKLCAIVFSDIVGYTEMICKNDKLTKRILEFNLNIHKELISKNEGIFVKDLGDGVLFYFFSVVNAVKCSILLIGASESKKYKLRIGIHIGDIELSEDTQDIVGAEVNISNRIQSKANPGEIYASREVCDIVSGKLDVEIIPIGVTDLKNVDRLVHINRIKGNYFATKDSWKAIKKNIKLC